ncbi:MAG: hypothetical protein ABI664_19935 [bacterium]
MTTFRRGYAHIVTSYGCTVFLAMIVLAPVVAAQSPSSSPIAALEDARTVYASVDKAVRQHQLVKHDTTVTCRENDLETRGSVYVDRQHRIRRLNTEGGTSDHGERIATYFDTLGRARFSFAERGAVNGTQQEERVYFDARGSVVRRVVRRIKGPGYPFERLRRAPLAATWVRDLCG